MIDIPDEILPDELWELEPDFSGIGPDYDRLRKWLEKQRDVKKDFNVGKMVKPDEYQKTLEDFMDNLFKEMEYSTSLTGKTYKRFTKEKWDKTFKPRFKIKNESNIKDKVSENNKTWVDWEDNSKPVLETIVDNPEQPRQTIVESVAPKVTKSPAEISDKIDDMIKKKWVIEEIKEIVVKKARVTPMIRILRLLSDPVLQGGHLNTLVEIITTTFKYTHRISEVIINKALSEGWIEIRSKIERLTRVDRWYITPKGTQALQDMEQEVEQRVKVAVLRATDTGEKIIKEVRK